MEKLFAVTRVYMSQALDLEVDPSNELLNGKAHESPNV